jgi:hypothetical protein
MRQPLGGLIPSFLNFSDCCIGSTLVWWERRDKASVRVKQFQKTAPRLDSHGLDQLFDLLVQPSNIRISIRRLLVHLHRLDSRVVFCSTEKNHPPLVNFSLSRWWL